MYVCIIYQSNIRILLCNVYTTCTICTNYFRVCIHLYAQLLLDQQQYLAYGMLLQSMHTSSLHTYYTPVRTNYQLLVREYQYAYYDSYNMHNIIFFFSYVAYKGSMNTILLQYGQYYAYCSSISTLVLEYQLVCIRVGCAVHCRRLEYFWYSSSAIFQCLNFIVVLIRF